MDSKILWKVFTAFISLAMGFSAFYTFRIGTSPSEELWKTKMLMHVSDIPYVLLCSAFLYGLFSFLIPKIGRIPCMKLVAVEGKPTDPPFAILSVFLVLAWLPFFFVFFPGTGMNDTTDIIRAGIWATGQHTFIYCMYLWGLAQGSIYLFGTIYQGLVAASLIQMFLFALGIAYALSWFYRKTGNWKLLLLFAAYYGFLPCIVNMSFSNVKDVFFSLDILLWVPLMISFVSGYRENAWEGNKKLFILAGMGMLLLRNNGIYVFVCMALFCVFWMKPVRMKVFLTSFVMVLVALIPNAAVQYYLNLPQLFQERVGIPLQQYSRAVAMEVPLTKSEENYTIRVMMPSAIQHWYDPFMVDLIKWNSNFNYDFFNHHEKEFWDNWKSVGKRNKQIYVEAWLFATYGYWSFPSMDEKTQSRFTYAFSEEELENGLAPEHNNDYRTNVLKPFFPPKVQESLGHYLWTSSRFLGAGTVFWIMMGIASLLIYRKQYGRLVVLLPATLLWGTLMVATPAAFVYRYVYFFPLCFPFFLILPFMPIGKYGVTHWELTKIHHFEIKKGRDWNS